jgi:hypothetical protein
MMIVHAAHFANGQPSEVQVMESWVPVGSDGGNEIGLARVSETAFAQVVVGHGQILLA